MTGLDNQTSYYWDAIAATKRFTHPLHSAWLEPAGRDAAVLDYAADTAGRWRSWQSSGSPHSPASTARRG